MNEAKKKSEEEAAKGKSRRRKRKFRKSSKEKQKIAGKKEEIGTAAKSPEKPGKNHPPQKRKTGKRRGRARKSRKGNKSKGKAGKRKPETGTGSDEIAGSSEAAEVVELVEAIVEDEEEVADLIRIAGSKIGLSKEEPLGDETGTGIGISGMDPDDPDDLDGLLARLLAELKKFNGAVERIRVDPETGVDMGGLQEGRVLPPLLRSLQLLLANPNVR